MQLSELKQAMKGVFVVQTTPFNKDGSLDLEGIRANTRWLVKRMSGKDFVLIPVGSTGEFYAMSDDECQAVIKVVVEEAKGKLPVIAGTGRAGTLETIKMCQYAESVGVDGVMVILPYYHIPEEEGMYVLRVKPDAKKLVEYISRQSIIGVDSPTLANAQVETISNMIQHIEITQWVEKNSFLPRKFRMRVLLEGSGVERETNITLDMYDYNKPADIRLNSA